MQERAPEPVDGDEREVLTGWLAFHRDALAAKCAGLTDEQLVLTAAAPSDLSLLGLVRHLTEMERVYLVWALGGGQLQLVYCTDEEPDGDIVGIGAELAAPSMRRWQAERQAADALLAGADSLDAIGAGNRRSVRWNVVKLLQEYARHNGHADLIRQRIDGATGE
jgi:Protein of unknown function (DUF664)